MSMSNSRKSVGTKVYIGDILESVTARDIEDELSHFGPLTENPWIARNPPGFAFVYFKRSRDADTAIRILNGNNFCGSKVRVELGLDQQRGNAKLNDSRNSNSRGAPQRKRPRERERHLRPPSPHQSNSKSKDSRSRSKFDRFDDRYNNNDEDDIYDNKDDNRRPLSPVYRSRSPLSHRRRSRTPQRRHDLPAKIPSLMDLPLTPVPVVPLLPDLVPTRQQRSKTSGAALRRAHRNNTHSGTSKRRDRLPQPTHRAKESSQSPRPNRKRSRHYSSPPHTVPPPQGHSHGRDPDRRSPDSRLYLPQTNQSRKSSSKRPASQHRGASHRGKAPEGDKYSSKSQRMFRSLSPRSPPRNSKHKLPNVPPPLMSQIVGPLVDSVVPPPAPLMGNDFLARYGSPLRDHSPSSPISQSSNPDYNSRKTGSDGNHTHFVSCRRTPPKAHSSKRARSPYISPSRGRSPLPRSDKYSSPNRGKPSLKSKVGRYVSRSPLRQQSTRLPSGRSPIKSIIHKRYKSESKPQRSHMTEYSSGRASGRDNSTSHPQKYSSYNETQSYRREDRLTPPRSALGAVYTPAEHRSLSPLDDSQYMTYLPPPPLPPPLLPPPRPKKSNWRRNKGVKSRMSIKERREARKKAVLPLMSDRGSSRNIKSRSSIRNSESSKQYASKSIPPPLPMFSNYDSGERHSHLKTRHYTPPPLPPLPSSRSRDKPRRALKPNSARQAAAARIKQKAMGASRGNANHRNQPRSRIRERRR
ncbi:unnamed protein product [Owenia fusiformis]|uniref:Uncharacterized protein n=1 Tax=Owenia fusiformis TaxID=6347 RepID=A0A8J1Y6A3_OWEFU|nr:unnamed protein product [Owenia fusiformis]